MEAYLVHGPGEVQGHPYRLHDDLRLFWWRAYELRTFRVGRKLWAKRRFDEAVLTAPKGVAKSETAGGGCCVEALGPVQFDGWDSSGNPVGRPRETARVLIFANDEDQTGNCYENVGIMLGPETCRQSLLTDYGLIDIGKHEQSSSRVTLPGHRGSIEPKTSRANSKEGAKPTFLVMEETHTWKLPGMHTLYDTNVKGLLKLPDTWGMHATNWFGPGELSVLELIHEDRGVRPDLLWFGRQPRPDLLPKGVPLRQLPDAVLREALRETYGSAGSYMDFDRIIGYIRRSTSKDATARRFYLNQGAPGGEDWLGADVWQERMTSLTLQPKDRVGLGFVGVDRCVALVGCRLADRLLQPLAIWEDEEPSRDDVDAAVEDAFERFRVPMMLVNPWGWKSDLERWAGRYGLKVVLRFPVREDARMAVALDRFETAVGTAQLLHVGAEPLTKAVAASATKTTKSGHQLVAKEPRLGITVAQAAVLAHEAACLGLAVPVEEPPPPPAAVNTAAGSPGGRSLFRPNGRLRI